MRLGKLYGAHTGGGLLRLGGRGTHLTLPRGWAGYASHFKRGGCGKLAQVFVVDCNWRLLESFALGAKRLSAQALESRLALVLIDKSDAEAAEANNL